jgi:hypothetical protein
MVFRIAGYTSPIGSVTQPAGGSPCGANADSSARVSATASIARRTGKGIGSGKKFRRLGQFGMPNAFAAHQQTRRPLVCRLAISAS